MDRRQKFVGSEDVESEHQWLQRPHGSQKARVAKPRGGIYFPALTLMMRTWAWWLIGIVLLLVLLRYMPVVGGGLILVLVAYLTVRFVQQQQKGVNV
jgi:hypothetical protein